MHTALAHTHSHTHLRAIPCRWVGCSVPYDFPDALRTQDLGQPLGRCAESAPGSGLFSRQWSKGTSSVDCNTMQGSVVVAR